MARRTARVVKASTIARPIKATKTARKAGSKARHQAMKPVRHGRVVC